MRKACKQQQNTQCAHLLARFHVELRCCVIDVGGILRRLEVSQAVPFLLVASSDDDQPVLDGHGAGRVATDHHAGDDVIEEVC